MTQEYKVELYVHEKSDIRKDKDSFENFTGVSMSTFYHLPLKIQKRTYKAWREDFKQDQIVDVIAEAKIEISRRKKSELGIRWREDNEDYSW